MGALTSPGTSSEISSGTAAGHALPLSALLSAAADL